MNATASEGTAAPEDHAYFLAIERAFLGLRQKATLLSAADWQEAQGWHRRGIPVEVVQNVMEQLFERQRAKKGRTISGLRYFRAAVEVAWQEMLALQAGGRAEESSVLPVQARLDNLAGRLPEGLPQRERWVAAILALAGPLDEVEAALKALDATLLAVLRAALDPAASAAAGGQVERALARLRGRLAEADLGVARQRLEEQVVRRAYRAPVLSLFSPEARGEDQAPDSGG